MAVQLTGGAVSPLATVQPVAAPAAQVPSQPATAIAARNDAAPKGKGKRSKASGATSAKGKGKPAATKGKEGAPRRYLPIGQYGPNSVVTVLVANPKRGASKLRFAKYGKPGTKLTVEKALKAGIWALDLSWDLAHGFITIANPAKASKPKPAAPAPAVTKAA